MRDKKGFMLIYVYIFIAALVVLGGTLLSRTLTESWTVMRSKQLTQAFNLADAGIDRALVALKEDFNSPQDNGTPIQMGIAGALFNLPGQGVGIGQYRYIIDDRSSDSLITDSNVKRIRAMGYVPNATSPVVTRWVEAYARIVIPPAGYFGNTVWTTGPVTLNGQPHIYGEAKPDGIDNDIDGTIDEAGEGGNVNYGTQITGDTSNVDGTVTPLPANTEFYYINFDGFKTKSIVQGNYYTQANLDNRQYMKDHPFPQTFLRNDGTTNVVYLEGDLDVSGNMQLGGIFIVARDVLANIGSTDLGGTIGVNGIIYSLGDVKIHGTVGLSGGVFAGSTGVLLKGTALNLSYNYDYMNAFKSLTEQYPSVKMKSWREPDFTIDRTTLK